MKFEIVVRDQNAMPIKTDDELPYVSVQVTARTTLAETRELVRKAISCADIHGGTGCYSDYRRLLTAAYLPNPSDVTTADMYFKRLASAVRRMRSPVKGKSRPFDYLVNVVPPLAFVRFMIVPVYGH